MSDWRTKLNALAKERRKSFEANVRKVEEGKMSAAALIGLQPESARGFAGFAQQLMAENDLEGAESAAELAVAADPRSFDGWLALGAARALGKKESSALAAYARAAEVEPNNARLWCDVGELKLLLLDYEGAAQALKFALDADPKGETPGGRRAQGLIARTYAKLKGPHK